MIKRGQVTIFILLAVVIVAGVLTYYFLYAKPTQEISPKENPQGFIEKCIEDNLRESIDKIVPQGGVINPNKYILYNGSKAEYHCYVPEEKQLCTMVFPLFKQQLETQLQQDSITSIEQCFQQLKSTFSDYEYEEETTNYKITISPKSIEGSIEKKITITKDGNVQTFEKFAYKEASPLFDFILLSNEILTQETTCDCGKVSCTADVLQMSKMNKDYELSVFVTSKNEKIYTIKDVLSEQELNFAVRNCILLP